MNTKYKVLSLLIALSCFFVGCEDDADSPVLLENPVVAKITSFPDMILVREAGADELEFAVSPVEVGFNASVVYYLEACMSGNNFQESVVLYSGNNVDKIVLTNSELNNYLLTIGQEDDTGDFDFRIRTVLRADAGNGVAGHVLLSEVATKEATIYGLLRLDLIGAGDNMNIKSPASNGIYSGYVDLDSSKPFTITDPETGFNYGIEGGSLVKNSASSFAPAEGESGYHLVTVDVNNKTFTAEPFRYGFVGSATPNGWDTPDSKMKYNDKLKYWEITVDLVEGNFKFRLNDGWNWDLGGKGTDNGTADNYESDGKTIKLETGGKDIPVLDGAGNYTIKLYVEQEYAIVVKNN